MSTCATSESTAALSLEDPAYVVKTKSLWERSGCRAPLAMTVVEYLGHGDPAFGGAADDRALGPDGKILGWPERLNEKPVVFHTIDAAHAAAKLIKNRRDGSILGVCPVWR